jgi:hypothetical protein
VKFSNTIQLSPNHTNADARSRYPDEGTCNCYRSGVHPVKLPCKGCKHFTKLQTQLERFETDIYEILPIAVRSVAKIDNEGGLSEGCAWMQS